MLTISSRRDSGFAGWDARMQGGAPPARDTAAIAALLRGFARPARQRRRPPLTGRAQSTCPEGLARNRAVCCALTPACTPVQAVSHRFELIPMALQRGCLEIVNTFSARPPPQGQAGPSGVIVRAEGLAQDQGLKYALRILQCTNHGLRRIAGSPDRRIAGSPQSSHPMVKTPIVFCRA